MKKLMTEWRQFLNEQSTEERVAAIAKRAKAFDAKMRKKHYGAEDAEESQKPEDLKKSYAAKEKSAFKQSRGGEVPEMYFVKLAATLAGHLSGKRPTGYDRPENADNLLKQFSQSFNELGRKLDNNSLVNFMKAAGLPTSLKFDAEEDKIQKQVAASQPEHDKAIRAALTKLFGEDYKNMDSDLKHYAKQRRLDPEAYAKSRARLQKMYNQKQNVEQMMANNVKTFQLIQKWNQLYMQQDKIIKQNLAGGKVFNADTDAVASQMNKIQQQLKQIEAAQNKLAGTKI
tara:strand:- start:290 stop:1147 length:858 start_codon:yes stop_codon:yes gene_type:complete